MIFRANLVITFGSAICCVIATAVTGEAAGVAIANWDIKNSNATIPVGGRPIIEPKRTKNGINRMQTIMLFATLVNTTPIAKATTKNTIGGRAMKGIISLAIAAEIPASAPIIY